MQSLIQKIQSVSQVQFYCHLFSLHFFNPEIKTIPETAAHTSQPTHSKKAVDMAIRVQIQDEAVYISHIANPIY